MDLFPQNNLLQSQVKVRIPQLPNNTIKTLFFPQFLSKQSTAISKSPALSFHQRLPHISFRVAKTSLKFTGVHTSQSLTLEMSKSTSYRRDHRPSKSALLDGYDGLEEGSLRASSSYSHDLKEHDNDKALDTLHDRVSFLKRITGDIHQEVESHNRLLDRIGNKMDVSRGIMSGTMDRFKMVFEKKSSRRMCTLVACFVISFFLIFYLLRILRYVMHN